MENSLWRELALSAPPVTQIDFKTQSGCRLPLAVLRLDLIHPHLSGNKVFKLLPNLLYAREQGIRHLLSFGGVYSNHIHALAYAGMQAGFTTTGIIRGQDFNTATLQDASQWGMQLCATDFTQYRKRHDSEYFAQLQARYPAALIIPEGGANQHAVGGFKDVFRFIETEKYTGLICACGTGTTLAGLINAMPADWQAIGIAVLKAPWMKQEVGRWLDVQGQNKTWQTITDAHLGGYAKVNDEYLGWLADFEKHYALPLDPVYTGKVMFALWQEKIPLAPDKPWLVIHTGGLQGKRGFLR